VAECRGLAHQYQFDRQSKADQDCKGWTASDRPRLANRQRPAETSRFLTRPAAACQVSATLQSAARHDWLASNEERLSLFQGDAGSACISEGTRLLLLVRLPELHDGVKP